MEADGFHLGVVLGRSCALRVGSGTQKQREMQKPGVISDMKVIFEISE